MNGRLPVTLEGRWNPSGHFVYLLWGESPIQPLYVGSSTEVVVRLSTHMRNLKKRGITDIQIQLIRYARTNKTCSAPKHG